jgi:PPOX class probable FMN-dependent enzyme
MPEPLTSEGLRGLYGEPSHRARAKELTSLDAHARAFIALSPFLVIATANAQGQCDAAPRGDAPGFVAVLDSRRLLIPDRRGNNRIDSLGNITANPEVGLLFLVPGIQETLRVNGAAQITLDPMLLEPLAVDGKAPRSGLLVTVREIFFHCGKALIRSDLWNPARHVPRGEFPSFGRILADQIEGIDAAACDLSIQDAYKTQLY